MGRELSHEEVVDLLGAYALDALELGEHEAVDGHVQGCAACLAEVAEHREVAGLLTPGWARPPAGLWDKIAASLEESPPPLDLAPVIAMKPSAAARRAAGQPPRRRIGVGIAAMVAAAAVAMIGFLGVRVADEVKGALAALPPEERRAIELAYFGGHTYREVASMLAAPEGTVKSRIRAGLRRMQRSLAESGIVGRP